MNSHVFPSTENSTIAPTTQDREPLCVIVSGNPEFLDDLAGIGTGAYLDMRQADVPEYEEWRDANFLTEGPGAYFSEEGITYTEDDLERIYGVLLQEAANPLVSRLFDAAEIIAGELHDWD